MSDYFEILIFEDWLTKKFHNVYFITENQKYEINQLYQYMGINIPIINNSIDYQLDLLGDLTESQLINIGIKITAGDMDKQKSLYEKNYKIHENIIIDNLQLNNDYLKESIEPYIKLLEIKHNFKLLKRIKINGFSLLEGIIPFNNQFNQYGWNDLNKKEIFIRIYNNNARNIYLKKYDGEYIRLSKLLKQNIDIEFIDIFSMNNEDLENIFSQLK